MIWQDASEILLIFVTEFFLSGYQLNDKTGKQLKIIIKEEKNIFFLFLVFDKKMSWSMLEIRYGAVYLH